ncbi:MAG TPA: cellulase family glycosylhydrolase [Candidatus Dormibacteraeota bacterium]|nr:cellulase family glycosylhydrolase [Candidatus Dormibacteraeota bacterium]
MRAPRYLWRSTAVLLVVVLAAITYPGAVLVSMIVRLTPPPATSSVAPQGALPWLHVEHPQGALPYIADDRNRMVLLHGAIPASLIDFWSSANPAEIDAPPFYPIDPAAYDGRCPDNSPTMPVPPLCRQDLVDMAALGFNSLRLPLSWSLLEPSRGQFNQMYIDRVAQVVDWARPLGIYVIIDLHQNAYSRYVGRPNSPPLPGGSKVNLRYKTGAPAWATITDGFPSEDYASQREANPAVLEADTNFWYNRSGIQDEYISAVAQLANRFKGDSTVAGYSIFNEPLEGWNLPPGFEDLLLFPFYRRVVDAITGVHDGLQCWTGFFLPAICGYRDLGVRDQRHLIFLDTGLLREITDFPTHLGLPVSSYPNLVLGMHAYTHGYTFDALAGQKPDQAGYPWGGYDQTYSLAEREAKVIGAALFVTEFGNDPQWDGVILPSELREQERHLTGFAFWTWKENGGNNAWGVYAAPESGVTPMPSGGCIRYPRQLLLSRVYPRASADSRLTYQYDSATGAFSLRANGRPGDAATVVYVPRHVTGDVTTSGAATESVTDAADGSRLIVATPSGGNFSINVAPAKFALTDCV